MPTIILNKTEFEKLVGKELPLEELKDRISMLGTDLEKIEDDKIHVEIFPNRPDLLSEQGFARAFSSFIGIKTGLREYNVKESGKKLIIEPSVKEVRPYTACAIVKNLLFNEEKIREIIQIQEKLHVTYGRNRKKAAIGIYPLEKITFPITYKADTPNNIKFKPLESEQEMTGLQILSKHKTGKEFAHLLEGKDKFPFFIDANNKILSMPPIINSDNTGRITEETKEIFIECSGHNLFYLKKCLNILISALYGMGGKVYGVNIKDSKDSSFVSPDMSFEEREFKIEDIEKTLGIKITENELKKYFSKMGLGFIKKKNKNFALIPPYRTDILHWIDLAEEVAIAYGYNNFEPEIPEISTIGEENSLDKSKKIISNILAGLGLLETSSFYLTTKKNIKKMHYEFNDFIEVEDSKTERDVLRMDLLTNHLQILSENSDSVYPQRIFEMGRVFSKDEKSETGIKETEKLIISLINEEIRFTDLKQIFEHLLRMLDKKYEIKETQNNNFIEGRVGVIIIDEKEIGFIGEVAPRVLKNWKIKTPVVAMEVKLESLVD